MDLIGKQVGRLTVIGKSTKKGYVICQCTCGNIKHIRATQLTMAHPIQSCGCLQREVAQKTGNRLAKQNFANFYNTTARYATNLHSLESKKLSKNNKSGVRGVWYNEKRGLWEAYISIYGKKHNLGRYGKKEDAIKARKNAEAEFFEPVIERKHKEDKESACVGE